MPKQRRKSRPKSKPRKTSISPAEEWFSIRRILDERTVKGHTEYLVDWEDNPETKEPYTPTWSREVTDEAKGEWDTKKAAELLPGPPLRSSVEESPINPASPASPTNQGSPASQESPASQGSQESEPPRPANYRKIKLKLTRSNAQTTTKRKPPTSDLNDRAQKVPRLEYSQSPSEEPVPSITSLTSLETTGENLDSLAPQSYPRQGSCLLVEIQQNTCFDVSSYQSVTNTATSAYGSQTLAEHEEEVERIAIATNTSQPTNKTIPDSQETCDQSWTRQQDQQEQQEQQSQGQQDCLVHQQESQEENQQPLDSQDLAGFQDRPSFGWNQEPQGQRKAIPELELDTRQELEDRQEAQGEQPSGGTGQEPQAQQEIQDHHRPQGHRESDHQEPEDLQESQALLESQALPESQVLQEPPFLQEPETHPASRDPHPVEETQLQSEQQDTPPSQPSLTKNTTVAGRAEHYTSDDTSPITEPHQINVTTSTTTQAAASLIDIPSHQPSRQIANESGNQALPSTIQSAASSEREITTSSEYIASQPGHGTSPYFLTQQTFQPIFSIPESSVFSQVLESPYNINQSPANNLASATLRPTQSSSASSQAAQIARHPAFDSPFRGAFSNDNSTGNASSSQGATRHSNHSNPGGWQPINTTIGALYNSEITELRSGPAQTRAMEASTPQRSAPQQKRRSAVDELSMLLDIRDDSEKDLPSAQTMSSSAGYADSQGAASSSSIAVTREEPPDSTFIPEAAVHIPAPANNPPVVIAPLLQSHQSAAQSLQDIVSDAFSSSSIALSGALKVDQIQEMQGTTVSLAEISKHHTIPLVSSMVDGNQFSSIPDENSQGAVTMAQATDNRASPSSLEPHHEVLEHLITLPFQASRRPFYDDILVEGRRDITRFGSIFSGEIYEEPDAALVNKIDSIFNRLYNVCDYPEDAVGTNLEELPSIQQAKYACDSNPKFSFVYELFRNIRTEKAILIVARSSHLLRLLSHLAEALELEYSCNAIGVDKRNLSSTVRLTLSLPDEEIRTSAFDVFIGFDHSFLNSVIARDLSIESSQSDLLHKPTDKSQLILTLVTTHSVEHIALSLADDLPPLEQKNALLSGVVRARQLVRDPERGYPEPHEIAESFADYLNNETQSVDWEPVLVPEEVLDIYANSQTHSQKPMHTIGEEATGNKRKLDDIDDKGLKKMRADYPERPKAGAERPPLPDAVRTLLDTAVPTNNDTAVEISVPLPVLEDLAGKFAELQRKIEIENYEAEYKGTIARLEKQVQEYERTNRQIYRAHRTSLENSNKFRAEKTKADTALQSLMELNETEKEKARKRMEELEATNARLVADPDLAKSQSALKEAQDKVLSLEKRLANAQQDVDYVRNLYQDVRTSMTAVQAENHELQTANATLQKQASETMAQVHQIQAQSASTEFLRQIRDLQSQVRERELQLTHVHDEMRQLKSGRRETRQVSVPRSPRMGLMSMSPRPSRIYGGSGSRGTSPAPALGTDAPSRVTLPSVQQFLTQQAGSGRWNHLQQ